MKPATVKQLKNELPQRSPVELMQLVLRLSTFKKENKELLTYLLFEAHDEANFIAEIKVETDEEFQNVNTSSYYFMKKSIRKILRRLKTYIRYSKEKETEVALLIYFCQSLVEFKPNIFRSRILTNIFERQLDMAQKALDKLHEDLQFEYRETIEELENIERR